MDFTDKTTSYIRKRLRQKGYLKNTSQTGNQNYTLGEVRRSQSRNKGKPMANSPYSSVTKKDPSDAHYKSKYDWLFDPVKGVQWDFNPVQLRELAQDDAWVQMLVNTMTTEIANTPWQIVEDDNSEVAKSNLNPFQRVAKGEQGKQSTSTEAKKAEQFLKNPNPDEDFTTFIEQVMADYLEVGSMSVPKAFSENDYDAENNLVSDDPELVHVKPSDPVTFTKDYQGKTGILKGFWQYDEKANRNRTTSSRGGSRTTKPIQFERQEVAWKDINPRTNRRYGLPPTLAVRDILMLLDLTINQEQDYWARGAFPSGFIKSNADIDEIGALKDEAQSERGRQGGMFHVPDVDAEWVQMANNWKEMEMNEREKWYAKIIASEFQVPMSVVGLKPEEVNRSTFEGERENFESNTLGPYLQDLERWITSNFIKPHFGENLRFEWKPGTSESQRNSISDRVNTEFQNGLITRNEAREQMGYEEVDENGFKDEVVDEPEPQQGQDALQDQLSLSKFEENKCKCQSCKEQVGKPFGPWESFSDCVNEMQEEQGYDKETAERVCGSLQAELKEREVEKMSENDIQLLKERIIEKVLVEKQKSFTDYPDAASENAQMALDAKSDTGDPNDCGTRTGWARANQLASNEAVSLDTVKRMSQFSRHEDNKEQSEEEGRADCGWMMWKAWGGNEGIAWAEDKVDEVEENEEKSCDNCGNRIEKDSNKRFCDKSCYNEYLSKKGPEKKEEDEPLRSEEEYFKYDFQPRHVEQFKEELQEPINESLKSIFRNDRFNQLVESFAEEERNDNSTSKNSAELRRVLNELIKDAAMTKAMENVVQEQSTAIAVTALEDQVADTGLSADTDEVTERLENRNLNFVDNFSQRMEESIRNTVSQGWQEGKSIDEIQNSLQEKADDLSDNQAERIARDQLQRATGEARNEFAKQHSDKFVEVWNAVSDNRTRPAHNQIDGKWKRPEEAFEVEYERANGIVKEQYPGQSRWGIQCRCRTDLVDKNSVSNSNYGGDGVA